MRKHEELALVLLNLAQQVVLQSTWPNGLIIDLNQPGQSSHNQEEEAGLLLDLNELPSPEEKIYYDDVQNMDGSGDAPN
ncbi:hypothetical protein Q3G72_019355 [Acer saccharum]|nr:hypothetical protein Q3G72_019355 [Acer saccharum]